MDPTEVLGSLGKKYSPDILRSADEPKSAQELSNELEIPVTTSYRRVETLNELGLLEDDEDVREFGETGQSQTLYRRNVEEIVIRFEDDSLEIESKERDRTGQPLSSVWEDLSRSVSGND
ncbi:helix-turn-helix domain-containing protein [Natrarchaeobius chitinivorans]|uniref:ArsR family transcriptional regulator n=1 Tax=Natrarchaeobius chitinivorans TaxID=1679083 RepID=A0A3N6P5W2_NATCH|nr:helix-turn-helix domain-containing protein [Natrarchaeobius chitinivorans]RQG93599.1 ArsR family transcriptional regulator [Natrarchaeobius chitinivorans]